MNAKKIMGAVLVALLAAALFVGAGAAAATTINGTGETVFVYQPVTGTEVQGTTWANGDNTITFEEINGAYAIKGANIVEGTYTKGEKSIIVKYPTAIISALGGDAPNQYDIIGGNLYKGDNVTITNATGAGINAEGYILTLDGIEYQKTGDEVAAYLKDHTGSFKIQAYFNANQFVNGTPANYLYGAAYTITVVEADDAKVTAAVDTVKPMGKVALTITAKPGSTFILTSETLNSFEVVAGQPQTSGNATITVPNTGKVTVSVQAKSAVSGKKTIELDNSASDKNIKTTVTIEKGTITAEADAASYFVGDVITITGKNSAGTINGISVKGTNFEADVTGLVEYEPNAGATATDFEFTLDTSKVNSTGTGKMLDVGTYTLTINATGPTATVAIVLKQPFISIVEAPEVVVKNTDVEFIINAEATTKIAYYIFGTNYFAYANVTTHAEDEDGEDIDNQFLIEFNKTQTNSMAAGQYFAVFQHPMYDGAYNITGDDVNWTISDAAGVIINVDKRQTANAAQALCDALDAQTIDDMYVKYSFFVVGKDASFTISDIPTTVAQGETITISGVSTAAAEDYVTVEMISTAFAAVPKETVGSAAFIVVTTQVAEDGTWEITLDTSDLNVDEYSLKVACGDDTWKNVNINVVEAGDEPVTPEQPEEPEQPEQPEEPVAPATPGFGALAALAGLGAVAVLLLRRE